MRVQEAAAAFIKYCAVRKLSRHTLRAYQLDLRRFERIAGGETAVALCDRDLLQHYVTELFETFSLCAASVKRHIATVHALFRWLEGERAIATDPFRQLTIALKLPRRLPRVLTRGELRDLLEHPASSQNGMTARVATEVLFATGIRVSELAGLRDADVDLDAGVVTIIGKGDRQRRAFIPGAELRELLASYRQRRRPSDAETFLLNAHGKPLSPRSIRTLVRRRAEDAHITRRVTPHMLRHSVATYLLEEGVDIRYVQRLLGHRSITTTEIYTHVADATLKAIICERHPRNVIATTTAPH